MESYIQISKINDFLYSPRSLYLHSIYEGFDQENYHETPQKIGKIKHANIESGTYSTAKRFLQGKEVYSGRYGLMGKIDIYDAQEKALIERKTRIKYIHDGYRFQLYAQMFGLEEAGYEVKKLFLHSLEDNKRYEIPLPNEDEIKRFEQLLDRMRTFDISKDDTAISRERADISIYRDLSY